LKLDSSLSATLAATNSSKKANNCRAPGISAINVVVDWGFEPLPQWRCCPQTTYFNCARKILKEPQVATRINVGLGIKSVSYLVRVSRLSRLAHMGQRLAFKGTCAPQA